MAQGPTIHKNANGEIVGYSPGALCFNLNQLSRYSHHTALYYIAHEIGHLLEHHLVALKYFNILGRSYTERLQKEMLLHLFEIQADIAYAQKNKDFAKTNYQAYLTEISNKRYHGEKNPHETFETHPSFFDRFHWIKKIVELHQKESAYTQKTSTTFSPTIE